MRTFIQQTSIKAFLRLEKPLYTRSGGKSAQGLFLSAVPLKPVGTSVRICSENETSTTIAKYSDDGNISDADFKILNSTDLHLEENLELNNKTLALLEAHIRDEKPDLILFTGDIVLTKYQQIDAVQFAQWMEKLGIYWAYVFGNHETREEKEYFKYLMLKSLSMYPHCLSKFGKPELFGYGNFIINILNADRTLRQSLVFFDSGRNICEPHFTADHLPAECKGGYDYIKPSQIKWYTSEIEALKNQYGDFRSMIYQHIPIPEYNTAFNQNADGTYSPSGKAKILYGGMFESVGCSPFNSHLFDAMKKNGTQAIFCGHDHVNDFAAEYDGILLVYVQVGGYNCYTMWDYNNYRWDEKDWQQGVTITEIHRDGSITLRQRFSNLYPDWKKLLK